jgi:hypothetical protein
VLHHADKKGWSTANSHIMGGANQRNGYLCHLPRR